MLKRETVEKALYEMGACFNGRANNYVTDAIMYIDDNGGLPIKWTGAYYSIAIQRKISPAAVERSIRWYLSKVRATSENKSAVNKYFGGKNACISETIGRFYTVLVAENRNKKEISGIDVQTEDVDFNSLFKELHRISMSLNEIVNCYKERWG